MNFSTFLALSILSIPAFKLSSRFLPYLIKKNNLKSYLQEILSSQTKNNLNSNQKPRNFIIITGATDGIGKQYVKHFLQIQYDAKIDIVVIGRNKQKLQELQNLAGQKQQQNTKNIIIPVKIDFCKDFQNKNLSQNQFQLGIQKISQQIIKKYKFIAQFSSQSIENIHNNQLFQSNFLGVINCCGSSIFTPFQKLTYQQIKQVNQININSLLFSLKLFDKFSVSCNPFFDSDSKQNQVQNKKINFREKFIVNISSLVSQKPLKYVSIYAAAKNYQNLLLKSYRKQNYVDLCHQNDENKYINKISQFISQKIIIDQKSKYSQQIKQNNKNFKIKTLNLKPWYVKTKMTNNMNTWDTIQPKQLVQNTFLLLKNGKSQATGSIKHQIIDLTFSILRKYFQKRNEQNFKKSVQLKQLLLKRKKK